MHPRKRTRPGICSGLIVVDERLARELEAPKGLVGEAAVDVGDMGAVEEGATGLKGLLLLAMAVVIPSACVVLYTGCLTQGCAIPIKLNDNYLPTSSSRIVLVH